jgi:glutamyl-tRNA reductase
MIKNFYIVAFTHRNMPVSEIGKLHIDTADQKNRLSSLKKESDLQELMFLSTCNRVEFIFVTNNNVSKDFLQKFCKYLYPNFDNEQNEMFANQAEIYSSFDAVAHLLAVASSIDSMVIGEREIITQVRTAFELSKNNGLTGDFIRLLMRHTIETAKRVYTETSIATKPVSVVSLAYHKLRELNVPLDARIVIIGAGITNTNMSRFLKKHGFKRFCVFNRTVSKAEELAKELNGKAFPLTALQSFDEGFDIIIACTGADTHIITPSIYKQLLGNDKNKKVVIDIALPQDLHPQVLEEFPVNHISVDTLQRISNQNLKERSKELSHVEDILAEALFEFKHLEKLRSVELAMRSVPEKVKEIKSNALNVVFKNDLQKLDGESKEVLEKIIGYMEKKYMSMPMIMAKEILLKK